MSEHSTAQHQTAHHLRQQEYLSAQHMAQQSTSSYLNFENPHVQVQLDATLRNLFSSLQAIARPLESKSTLLISTEAHGPTHSTNTSDITNPRIPSVPGVLGVSHW
jgi:hypothetical protein